VPTAERVRVRLEGSRRTGQLGVGQVSAYVSAAFLSNSWATNPRVVAWLDHIRVTGTDLDFRASSWRTRSSSDATAPNMVRLTAFGSRDPFVPVEVPLTNNRRLIRSLLFRQILGNGLGFVLPGL